MKEITDTRRVRLEGTCPALPVLAVAREICATTSSRTRWLRRAGYIGSQGRTCKGNPVWIRFESHPIPSSSFFV
jgi:hypothetical protein